MLIAEIGNKFVFSLTRVFLFLFFNALYSFLDFWIATTLLLFFPFAIAGFFFFIFVVLFQIGLTRIASTGAKQNMDGSSIKFAIPFILFSIILTIIYIAGVFFIQELIISAFKFPRDFFTIVSIVLSLISYGISFFLSFVAIKENTMVK